MPDSLKSYNPTLQEMLAQALMGNARPNSLRGKVVSGLIGTTGLSDRQPSVADITPLAPIMAKQDMDRAIGRGDALGGAASAMGIIPGAKGASIIAHEFLPAREGLSKINLLNNAKELIAEALGHETPEDIAHLKFGQVTPTQGGKYTVQVEGATPEELNRYKQFQTVFGDEAGGSEAKPFQHESAVPVGNYIPKNGDTEEGFSIAAGDRGSKDAIQSAIDEIKDVVGHSNFEVKNPEFLEFDSSNPSHAGAYHTMEIHGLSPEEIQKVRQELYGDQFEPPLGKKGDDLLETPLKDDEKQKILEAINPRMKEASGYPMPPKSAGQINDMLAQMTPQDKERLRGLGAGDLAARFNLKESDAYDLMKYLNRGSRARPIAQYSKGKFTPYGGGTNNTQ